MPTNNPVVTWHISPNSNLDNIQGIGINLTQSGTSLGAGDNVDKSVTSYDLSTLVPALNGSSPNIPTVADGTIFHYEIVAIPTHISYPSDVLTSGDYTYHTPDPCKGLKYTMNPYSILFDSIPDSFSDITSGLASAFNGVAFIYPGASDFINVPEMVTYNNGSGDILIPLTINFTGPSGQVTIMAQTPSSPFIVFTAEPIILDESIAADPGQGTTGNVLVHKIEP